jgi:SsrA-binding protein
MTSQVGDGGDRTISTNRRARHEYEILETVEAGLVLRGTEVKSLRDGGVTFKDSYATIRNTEGWLVGCHINPYSHGTDANHAPDRDRKLLLHRKELSRLTGKIAERGLTLVPLRLYFKRGRV